MATRYVQDVSKQTDEVIEESRAYVMGMSNPLPFGGPVVHLMATSDSPTGPFKKHNNLVFTVPGHGFFPVEDSCIWTQNGTLWAIMKDSFGHAMNAKLGSSNAPKTLLLYKSIDGMDWEMAANPLVSLTQVNWQKKGIQRMNSLERPQIWLNENGEPEILFCAVAQPGKRLSYNVHIPLLKDDTSR
jgi:hypothetical protein